MRRKVKVSLPKAQSGLDVKMGVSPSRGVVAGLGLNSNTMPWPIMAGKFAQPDIEVNESLKPVDREDANLEAEKGETAMVPDASGIPALYKINGKRHYGGGTPLNLPEDSFIFSRDKKMKIGGPILESFGKQQDTTKKFTPAELSNQYKINDFRQILADPNSDKVQRETAEKMITNYNLKLAKLGLTQESQKGFPDGIPAIAMPYMDMMGIDPSQFVAPQGQQPGQEQSQSQARFGGRFQVGGPTATNPINTNLQKFLPDKPYTPKEDPKYKDVHIDQLYNTQQQILANINSPGAADMYDKLEEQIQVKKDKGEKISTETTKQPTGWYTAEGKRMDTPNQGATGYWNRVASNISSTTDAPGVMGKPAPDKPHDWGNEEWLNKGIDPATLKGKVPTVAQIKTKEALSKLNPTNSSGVLDYLDNALTLPQKALNLGLTGNYETPGTTFLRNHPNKEGLSTLIDIGLDPLNFIGVGEINDIAKGTLKATKGITEYGKFIAQALPSITGLGFAKLQDFALKYAPEVSAYIAKNGKEALKSSYVQNVLTRSAISLLSSSNDKADISYKQRKAIDPTINNSTPTELTTKKTPTIQPTHGTTAATPVDAMPSSSDIAGTTNTTPSDTTGMYADYQKYLKSQPKQMGGITKFDAGGGIKHQDSKYITYNDGSVYDVGRKQFAVHATNQSAPSQKQVSQPSSISQPSTGDITSYTGDKSNTSNKSKYTNQDWRDFRDKYYPQAKTNKELQQAIATDVTHPEFGDVVNSLHKQFGKLKDNQNWLDGRLGHRWDAIMEKAKEVNPPIATPTVADTPNVINKATIPDAYHTPKAQWWLQDEVKTAGAFNDLMRIKKYQPWQATPGVNLPDGTFYDPTRELAANAEMVNQGVTGASTYSGPQGFAATAAMLQGQGAKAAADTMGRYNNMNVSESDRLSSETTGIMNQASQNRANSATQLYDKQTIANQQFDNAKNQGRQNLRQSFLDAITNRANTYNLNTMYPQYAIDPMTGGMAYNPTGSNKMPTKNFQPQDEASRDQAYIDAMMKKYPNTDPIAWARHLNKQDYSQPSMPQPGQ